MRCRTAGLLLATPPHGTSAGVSAFCDRCWRDLWDNAIEVVCARLLRKFVAGGRFEGMLR
jgi:hypothetical protein